MTLAKTTQHLDPRAPDVILAELWEIKREINTQADYRIEALVRMAREAGDKVRREWRDSVTENTDTR